MLVETFYRQFGLQRTEVVHDIHIHDGYADKPLPWYVAALIGAGGWMIGLAIVQFAIAILFFMHGTDPEALWLPGFGIGVSFMILGCSVRSLSVPDSVADGLILGGLLFAVAAVWSHFNTFELPLVLTSLAMIVSVRLGATLALQGLMSAMLAGLLAATAVQILVIGQDVKAIGWIFALQSLFGTVLFMLPGRIDLRALASVALISGVLSPVLASAVHAWPEAQLSLLISRAINLAALMGLFTMAWAGSAGTNKRIDVMLFAAISVAIVLALPPAGSAALIVLVLAWCRGSVRLALLGVMLEGFFAVFYFRDLSANLLDRTPDLMEKSLIMTGIGFTLLAVWGVHSLRRSRTAP